MSMRVGEMMVIVRAQDFASRTLRRVGGEFAHLSREQQIAARKGSIAWQRYDASQQRVFAREQLRQLKLAKMYREASREHSRQVREHERLASRLKSAEMKSQIARQGGISFGPAGGMSAAQAAAIRQTSAEVFRLRQAITQVDKATKPWAERMGRLQSVFSNYPAWVRKAAQSSVGWANGVSRVSAEYEKAHRMLTRAQQSQLAFDQAMARLPVNRLRDIGQALGGIGRTMQLFGAVTTVAFGAAANTAAQYNTEISLAATQARDLTAGADQVALRIDQMTNGFESANGPVKGVLDLMREFPATQTEMAQSAYDIFSSMNLMTNGITDVAGGMDLLAKANQIAVAGGEDLAIATDAMITVFNNFDPQLQNTNETLDTMFDIIRFGRMRLGDFNTMMNKIAPAAAGAGLSLRDVGGAMAFLTEVMPSQRMVATGISRLIEALRHPDVVSGLKALGVNVRKTTGELKPLDQVMEMLAERFPQLTTGQQTAAEFFKFVSSVGRKGGLGVMFTSEGRKALTQIMTHMDQFRERTRQIDQNQGEFAKTREAQMRALGVQWEVFLNRIRAVAIAIGTDAIPVFSEVGKIIERMLNAWEGLNEGTRQTIIRMAVWGSIGTLVAGAMLSIVGALFTMTAAFKAFRMSGVGITGMLTTIGQMMRRMAAIGVISLIIKMSVSGPPGWQDFATGGIFGAILGKKWGRMAMVKGAIVIPVILAITGGSLDSVTQRFNRWLIGTGDDMEKKSFFGIKWGKGIGKIMGGLGKLDNKMQGVKKGAMFDPIPEGALKKWRARLRDMRKDTPEGKQRQAELLAYQKAVAKHGEKVKKYFENMRDYREELKRHKDELKDWGVSLANATREGAKQAVDSLRNMYMEIEQMNKSAMGELFQGPLFSGESWQEAKEWGIKAGLDDLLKDMKMQTAKFLAWRQNLTRLIAAGAPSGMIDELKQMGMAGMDVVDTLAKGLNSRRKSAFTLPGQIEGMLAPGNIDIMNRKIAKLGKGVTASVRSMSIGMDGVEILIPTIINGKPVTPEQAIAHFKKTGQHLGKFGSAKFATAYADALHNQQAKLKPVGKTVVDQIFATYNQREKAVQSSTKLDFVDEIGRFRKAGVNMGNAIINGFEQAKVGAWFDSWVTTKFPAVINSAVNKAVTDFKVSTPRPVPPKRPTAPGKLPPVPASLRRTAAGGGSQNTSNDNSRTQTVIVNMGDSSNTQRDKRDMERRIAFVLRQVGRMPF